MRCQKQPAFLTNRPIQIADIWEVHLSSNLWIRLKQTARSRKSTLSRVTRYCVFRLVRNENLTWRKTIGKAHATLKAQKGSVHRHVVCLYGEDVVFWQLAATKLRISVSALIRIALYLYLPRLAMEIHSKKSVSATEFFWNGIKCWQNVFFRGLNHLGTPAIRQQTLQSFMPWQWWNTPHPELVTT